MAQNDLYEETSLGLYFSQDHSNKIILHSPKFGLLDYVSFSCNYKNSNEVFNAIKTEFLSSTIDEISKDYEIEAVCVAGSLFESKNLLNKFHTITAKSFPISLNKEMPIDDINLG